MGDSVRFAEVHNYSKHRIFENIFFNKILYEIIFMIYYIEIYLSNFF